MGEKTDPQISLYLRRRLEEEVDVKGRTLGEICERIFELKREKISEAALSYIKNGVRGAGWKTIRLLGAYFEESVEDMTKKAQKLEAELKRLAVQQEIERYPNRKTAIEYVRGKVRDEAIRRVLRTRLEREQDPSVGEWVDLISAENARITFFEKNPASHRKSDEQAEQDTEDLIEATRPRNNHA